MTRIRNSSTGGAKAPPALRRGLSRRQFLAATGLGAGALFLPSLQARGQALTPPKRVVVFFTQHGTVYDRWRMRPGGVGETDPFQIDLNALAENEFSEILAPLFPHRSKLIIADGVSMASAEADDLFNDHEKGTRHALTGEMLSLEDGSAGGPSVDQTIAGLIRQPGRIDTLELAVVGASNGGAIWRGAGQSIPPDSNAGSVFQRVFPPPVDGNQNPSNSDRIRAAQPSVLDLVARQYELFAPKLSTADRQKLDLHRDLVRSVEQRIIELANVVCDRPDEPVIDDFNFNTANFYRQRTDAMFSLAAAALACDLTRVITIQMFQLDNESIGAPPGDVHADFAHLQDTDDNAHQMMTNYGRKHAEQFAQFVALLDSIPEGNGTLLDNTAVVWCSELADGPHNYRPWPLVVAGGAGGALNVGQYVRYAQDVPNPSRFTNFPNYVPFIGPPHTRFWVSIANAVGADINSVGRSELFTPEGVRIDASGPLEGILA